MVYSEDRKELAPVNMAHGAPLGFDGLVPADDQGTGKDGEYTVEFSMTGAVSPDAEPQSTKRDESEEVGEGEEDRILSKKVHKFTFFFFFFFKLPLCSSNSIIQK